MPNQPKMLIAGGGYADIPLILAAKKLGFYVITSGNRSTDLGHSYSDEYQPGDFSSPETMLQIAQKSGVSAVCPCCNDFSALSSAYVAEQMGLPGHDSFAIAQTIHHKDRYREFALKNGIPTPRARWAVTVEDAMQVLNSMKLPLIVKPVDLTGGKGISTIHRKEQARAAFEKAFQSSKAKRVVVEEFLEGSRHGFSAFIRDGRVAFHFSDNEYYYLNPFLVAGAFTPGQVPEAAKAELCKLAETIAFLLNLKTGIFHVQYILHENRPVIIEICRRAPGDLYIKLVEHATGVDYASWIVRAAAGLNCAELNHADPKGFLTRHCVMASVPGTLKNVAVDPSIEGKIIDQLMWWKPGDRVQDVMTAKFGIVFVKFESQEEMVKMSSRLHELIVPQIDQRPEIF